jgi:hypothetical protein
LTVGEVAEWLMAPVLKTGIPERVSGVRIPPSPPLLSASYADLALVIKPELENDLRTKLPFLVEPDGQLSVMM